MKSSQELGGRTNNNGIQEVYDAVRETFSGEHRAIIECDIPKWMRNRLDKFNQGRQINTKEMLDKKVSPGGLHLFIDQIEQALLRLPVELILIERSRPIKAKLASLLHELGHANCFLKKCRCVEDAHFEERHFLCERHADEFVLSMLFDGGLGLKDVLRRMMDNIEYNITKFNHSDYTNIRRTAVWRRATKRIGKKLLQEDAQRRLKNSLRTTHHSSDQPY